MAKCLAFDASAEQCSVALLVGKNMEFRQSREPRSHSQNLLYFADDLLQQQNLTPANLSFITCSVGPGSFTGLRIAFSIAQAMSYAVSVPLIGVSSLDAIAEGAKAEMGLDDSTLLVCVLDARMGEIYWQAYTASNQNCVAVTCANLDSPDSAKIQIELLQSNQNSKNLVIVGPGSSILNRLGNGGSQGVNLDELNFPHAKHIVSIAQRKYGAGEMGSIENVELAYLRNSVTWNKRTKIRKPE